MPSHARRILAWSFVVLWMAVIFIGSSDLLSDERTSRFLGPFLRWLVPGISDAWVNALRFWIRKAGHATVYAVLATLVMAALQNRFDPRRWTWNRRRVLLTLTFCLLYAISDEWHQSWVPTRHGSAIDVAIDTLGAILALAFLRCLRRSSPAPRPSVPIPKYEKGTDPCPSSAVR